MKLNKQIIQKLIKAVQNTRLEELGCDDCFDVIHEFAEMQLQGKPAGEAMPLVQDHLDKCGDCREEFNALLEAMKAVN